MSTNRRITDRPDLPDLSSLDVALSGRGDRASSPAAQQLLTRILDTPRTASSHVKSEGEAPSPRRRPGVTHRMWTLAGGAAAVALGAVAVPAFLGGSSSAFASWTPTPTAVAPAEAASQQAECLAEGNDPGGNIDGALTERRGNFTFTLVATDEAIGNCMVLDPAITQAPGHEQGVTSWGSVNDLPIPAVDETSVQWGATFNSAAGEFTSAFGRVGTDVVAVLITSESEPSIQASVDDGYFAAWWPGKAEARLTVTTTLADGTSSTRTVQPGDR